MKLNIQLFAYTKKEWKDLPSEDTPILAADLNNIESGITANDTTSNSNATSIKNLITGLGIDKDTWLENNSNKITHNLSK